MADSLDQRIVNEDPATVAALIAEPVMGAGGVLLPPATYWDKVQAVLKRHDVMLIADEVICGFGRTGNMWGTITFGLKPDMISCAKALSSGYHDKDAVKALLASPQLLEKDKVQEALKEHDLLPLQEQPKPKQ